MSRARATHSPVRPRLARMTARRRGTVYLAVLAIAMLVFVIGVGGMMASRVKSREASLGSDLSAARSYAVSAVTLGRRWMASDPGWRTTKSGTTWMASTPFADGVISLEVTNPLGALDRSSLDPVVMVATGEKGAARQKLRVTLAPSTSAMSCLGVAWCVGGSMTLSHNITGPGLTIAANGNVTTNGGTKVYADVEAAGSVSGSDYYGSTKSGVASRGLPTASVVIAEYALIGSSFASSSLPIVSGDRTIQNQLISPASAPSGASPNAKGVYVLDCKNQKIVIQKLRVVGTIVFKNCSELSVKGPLYWSPAVVNYPCLITDGPLSIDADAAALIESGLSVNFNPSTTPFPYPSGNSNATAADYYACGINGIVYAAGTVTIDKKNWWFGPVISNSNLVVDEDVFILPRPDYASSPPPGFADVAMVPTLWEQVVD